ncbi:MAG: hypothetical protein J6K05_04190 [Bacteroidaceae bacterium]|nr:hypothetical protein [Bacteroidaceae bacterium]
MNLNVTQQNLYLFLPSKISWMVDMLMEDEGISMVEAIKRIYQSETYRKLEIEKTKMWHLGPVALYEDFSARRDRQ